MNQDNLGSVINGAFARLQDSALVRMLGTGILVLLMQIPIAMIARTIDERRTTKDAAFDEVTRTWGAGQELTGPILTVPFLERWVDNDNKTRIRSGARHFTPRAVTVRGRAETEVRRRGIFDVPLFVAHLRVEGAFVIPEATQFGGPGQEILWDQASVAVGIADPRAIRAASRFSFGAQDHAFEPGPGQAATFLSGGLHVPLAAVGKPGARVPFSFDLTVGGSKRLTVVPTGDETLVTLASPWPHPSFDGAWLPTDRRVSPSGFEASWRVLNLARNFPSSWIAQEVDSTRLSASAFGVSLLSPVDTYRTNERAVKYQILFVGLTFLGFALFELLAGVRIHPIQYLLVGLALCLFYLLLLSLSEHVGFSRAYGIAAVAVAGLVGGYVRFVLGKTSRALVVTGLLGALYGFLFVLLQIQDYALLVGSVGLFMVLAAVMWFTRRVKWYQLRTA